MRIDSKTAAWRFSSPCRPNETAYMFMTIRNIEYFSK
jgi:hypothetical protein